MDGSGDNQLTVRYNRRPVDRRLQRILEDYRQWEHAAAAFGNPHATPGRGIAPVNREFVMPMRFDTQDEDSGFESGSESDVL